jgi:AcrR family transcriptional regulator
MARTQGSSGPATLEAIRKAGLRLIYDCGYEGMSLRQLASEIGMVQGSLYNHISTKQELLFTLISEHMRNLLEHADVALEHAKTPSEQLAAFVNFHVNYHIDRKLEVFICYSELRSLEPQNFQAVVAMRRDYEKKLIAILKAGSDQGMFTIANPQVAAFGILSMLTGILNWYKPDGRLSPKQISEIYLEMTRGAVFDCSRKPATAASRTASKRLKRRAGQSA